MKILIISLFTLMTFVNGYQKIIGDTNGDEFGSSISISGDKMVVGATRANSNQGSAYTYQWSGSAWVEDAASPLVASGVDANDRYGDFVYVDGDLMVIGAFNDNSATGKIFTFEWSGTAWIEDSNSPHVPASLVTNDNFGSAGAIYGDFMVIGAWGTPNGSVYTFKRVGSNWVEQTGMKLDGDGSSDRFGEAISFYNNTLSVGARFEDNQANNAGAVYTYILTDGNSWVEDAVFLNPVGLVASDEFGPVTSVC